MFEMGGYLPLELQNGKEYFRDIPEKSISRYNSGKTAIYVALKSFNANRVWVPYFYCPSVLTMLRDEGFEVKYYFITKELLPENIDDDDAIILVNYYGIIEKKLYSFAEGRTKIIIDNSQAFFSPPLDCEGVLNVYSCRKFVGVGDGGYLIGSGQKNVSFEQDVSYERSMFLLKAIECGINGAYQESLRNEVALDRGFAKMSELTKGILDGIDYESVSKRRKENFAYVHNRMKNIQRLEVDDIAIAAYCYPLLLDVDIRSRVIEKKIYVPTLWKELIEDTFENKLEYCLAKNVLCLPIDQRYDICHMNEMCDIIIKLLADYDG